MERNWSQTLDQTLPLVLLRVIESRGWHRHPDKVEFVSASRNRDALELRAQDLAIAEPGVRFVVVSAAVVSSCRHVPDPVVRRVDEGRDYHQRYGNLQPVVIREAEG